MITSISQLDEIKPGSLLVLNKDLDPQIVLIVSVKHVNSLNCLLYQALFKEKLLVATTLLMVKLGSLDFIEDFKDYKQLGRLVLSLK